MPLFSPFPTPPFPLDEVRHNIKRIAISRTDHLGDFVCATPFFRATRKTFPEAEIVAVVRPVIADAAKACPYIDRVVEHRFDDMSTHRRMVRELREQGVDLAMALAPRSLDCRFTYAVGAKYRTGRIKTERMFKRWQGRFCCQYFMPYVYKGPIARGEKLPHEVESCGQFAKFMGFDFSDTRLELQLDAPTRQFQEQVIAAWGGERPKLSMHLHNKLLKYEKCMAAFRPWEYSDLMRLIKGMLEMPGSNGKLVITYGPLEANMVETMRQELERAIPHSVCLLDGAKEVPSKIEAPILFIGNLSVQRWTAMLDLGDVLITPDTGSVHLMAAMGKPIVDMHALICYGQSTQTFYPWQVPFVQMPIADPDLTVTRALSAGEKLLSMPIPADPKDMLHDTLQVTD